MRLNPFRLVEPTQIKSVEIYILHHKINDYTFNRTHLTSTAIMPDIKI